MANTQSAKKALRKDKKLFEYNLKIKQDLKTLLKKTRQLIDAKADKAKIDENIKQIQKAVDKAIQKNVLKKNNGSKKLVRIVKYQQKGGQPKIEKTVKKEEIQDKE